MSPAAAPPPSPVATARRKRRGVAGFGAWLAEKPETRSVQIGILATVLVHLLLLLMAPYWFRSEPMTAHPRRSRAPFNIRLTAPPPRKAPARKVLPKYVETNPNAPQNVPDHTNNVSNRNQQSAQEKPTKINNTDMPAQEGKKNFKNDQIVDGRLTKPQEEEVPQARPTPPRPRTQAMRKAEQNPLPGFEHTQGDNPTGFGTNIAKETANARPIPHHIDGQQTGPFIDVPSYTEPQIDPKHPRERKSLDVHSRPAIIAENTAGTRNVGVVGRDAHWSNYGAYLNRLEEAVQIAGDDIMDREPYPPPGSMVQITFKLNSAGEISQIVHVESSAGTTEIGTRACNLALTRPSPYGKWTDDMIAVFGTEQELTFTFYYE